MLSLYLQTLQGMRPGSDIELRGVIVNVTVFTGNCSTGMNAEHRQCAKKETGYFPFHDFLAATTSFQWSGPVIECIQSFATTSQLIEIDDLQQPKYLDWS